MKKYKLPIQISFCIVALVIAGCDTGKKRMLVPPGEPPAPMLVPSALATPMTKVLEKDNIATASAIIASDATDVTVENEVYASPAVSGKELFHLCRSGDTIKSVSEKHNININKLLEYNKLMPAQSLIPGKVLLLPRNLDSPATEAEITTYTVVKGDSYSRIARKFHISATALMRLNNAKDSKLDIGDVLYVPK